MTRCTACPTESDGRYCSRIIPAALPVGEKCDVLLIGAGPGKTEFRTGRPYSGLAGDELSDLYLPLAGLRRDKVAIGNATLCWDGTDRTPPAKRILECAANHLPELLERVQPTVVVLMGAAVMPLCDSRLRLDIHHGIPQYATLLDRTWEGWVFPSYEPALGMRDTGMMTHLMSDFKRLGEWLNGDWSAPVPDDEDPDYRVCETPEDFRKYVIGRPFNLIACDTENHGSAPWSVQISYAPRTGRLIRTDNAEVMRELVCWSRIGYGADVEWAFHFAQHDLDVLHSLGIEVRRFRDTMQESYALCALPQGLKALVYRLFGHEMRSWQDTVWPASVSKMNGWLNEAITRETLRPVVTETALTMGRCVACGKRNKRRTDVGIDFDDFLPRAIRVQQVLSQSCKHCGAVVDFVKREEAPNAVEAILRHILRYTESTAENDEPYNPWEKLPEMMENGLRGKKADNSDWDRLIEEVGELPVLGIGNCSEDEAVQYAVGDADYTLRVARELEKLRQGKEWKVDEEDYDV